MVVSIEPPRIYATEAARNCAHGLFTVLDRKVHFIGRYGPGMKVRALLLQRCAQHVADRIEISSISDESSPALGM
jgi:hypothetical protein